MVLKNGVSELLMGGVPGKLGKKGLARDAFRGSLLIGTGGLKWKDGVG